MKFAAAGIALLLLSGPAFAQRPSDPALLVPQTAPELDYVVVPDPIKVPAGTTMGASASVAFDANGHVLVLTRGAQPFFEFDENGAFVRAFGDGLFTRAHGLRIDADGNIWATDVGAHVVYKLNPQGQVLLTLGVKGEAGEWNEAAGSRKLNQPNDVAIADERRLLRRPGPYAGAARRRARAEVRQDRQVHQVVGRQGQGPGQFEVAHGIAIDAQGPALGDRPREPAHPGLRRRRHVRARDRNTPGLPCSLDIGRSTFTW